MLEDLHECYRLLDVEPGASLDEVKRSYRELVKVWHPDRFTHDPKLRDKAVDKLKEINLAYERLCAAGETFHFTARPRDERSETRQERSEEYASRTYERGYARQQEAPEPPRPPRSAPRDIWWRRLRYGGPLAGLVVTVLLIFAFYPRPQPRFLIEVPPDAPLPAPARAPARDGVRRARPAAAARLKLPTPKFFSVGSTKAEVIEAQGPPDRATETLFVYGTSDVYFQQGKVKSWRNGHPRLKAKMAAAVNLGGREYFTMGSSKDQVIDAQGTPDSFTDSTFTYGTSKVYFKNGKVKAWRILYPAINVRFLPSANVGSPTHFSVGSTKDEVLAVQGTPDEVTDSEFNYGTSRVYFEKGRVRSWHSRSPRLNAKPPA